jgi:hypothetical protein
MGFGTVLKLQRYLSRQNLETLDKVLKGLTDPREQESFQAFWSWFGKQDGIATPHVEHAVRALGELRKILRDHLSGKG